MSPEHMCPRTFIVLGLGSLFGIDVQPMLHLTELENQSGVEQAKMHSWLLGLVTKGQGIH